MSQWSKRLFSNSARESAVDFSSPSRIGKHTPQENHPGKQGQEDSPESKFTADDPKCDSAADREGCNHYSAWKTADLPQACHPKSGKQALDFNNPTLPKQSQAGRILVTAQVRGGFPKVLDSTRMLFLRASACRTVRPERLILANAHLPLTPMGSRLEGREPIVIMDPGVRTGRVRSVGDSGTCRSEDDDPPGSAWRRSVPSEQLYDSDVEPMSIEPHSAMEEGIGPGYTWDA